MWFPVFDLSLRMIFTIGAIRPIDTGDLEFSDEFSCCVLNRKLQTPEESSSLISTYKPKNDPNP